MFKGYHNDDVQCLPDSDSGEARISGWNGHSIDCRCIFCCEFSTGPQVFVRIKPSKDKKVLSAPQGAASSKRKEKEELHLDCFLEGISLAAILFHERTGEESDFLNQIYSDVYKAIRETGEFRMENIVLKGRRTRRTVIR
jgi:hypothetical protein